MSADSTAPGVAGHGVVLREQALASETKRLEALRTRMKASLHQPLHHNQPGPSPPFAAPKPQAAADWSARSAVLPAESPLRESPRAVAPRRLAAAAAAPEEHGQEKVEEEEEEEEEDGAPPGDGAAPCATPPAPPPRLTAAFAAPSYQSPQNPRLLRSQRARPWARLRAKRSRQLPTAWPGCI